MIENWNHNGKTKWKRYELKNGSDIVEYKTKTTHYNTVVNNIKGNFQTSKPSIENNTAAIAKGELVLSHVSDWQLHGTRL